MRRDWTVDGQLEEFLAGVFSGLQQLAGQRDRV
jgi:hypothetical protein